MLQDLVKTSRILLSKSKNLVNKELECLLKELINQVKQKERGSLAFVPEIHLKTEEVF